MVSLVSKDERWSVLSTIKCTYVHDDCLAVRKSLLLLLGGLGTVVKTHPTVRDLVGRDDLGLGIGGELVGDNNVGRKNDLLSELLCLFHDGLGSVNEVVLDQRGTDVVSLGLQEGEDHTSTNDDLVALVEEGLKDGDLGRDLGSTDNGGHGLLSVLNGSLEVLELLGEQESTNRRLEELGNTLSGSMGTVGSSESVVDVKVEGLGELLDESRLVLGLLLVETSVLEHDHISLLGRVDDLLDFLTNAVRGKGDLLSEKLSHALSARSKGELVLWSILGASQVRADSDDGALALQVLNGGDGRTDTSVVSDLLAIERDVHVASNKDLLSLQVLLGEVLNGHLGLQLEKRRSSDAAHANRAYDQRGREDTVRQKPFFSCRERTSNKDTISRAPIIIRNLRTGAKAETELEVAKRATRTALENFMVGFAQQRI